MRELENVIESAVVISEQSTIGPDDLPLPDRPPVLHSGRPPATGKPPSSHNASPRRSDVPLTLEEVERRHILDVMKLADSNQTLAAKLLGIGRNTLARKLKKYEV